MLKPGLVIEDDSYNRLRPDHPDSVFVDGDTEFLKSFEISKIIDKRVTHKGTRKERGLPRKRGRPKKVPLPPVEEPRNSEPRGEL